MTAPRAHLLLQGRSRLRDRSPAAVMLSRLLVVAAYVGTVALANYTSTSSPAVILGPLIIPAGTLWAGMTFTLRDLLHETLGPSGVTVVVAAGAGLSWLLASPQIAVASVVAFAVSEALDSALYAMLRPSSRIRAVLASNLAGLVVDSLLFVPLAFGSFAAAPGQVVGKAVATLLTLAVLWGVRRSSFWAVPR
ncbi:hypothetical protein SAMN04488074_13124 [Lentzea albidocapillata subsp. violacea]|uniref:Vitamin uptake transporter n=2 Tax=Lentzea albidocapillata TaxID=40571 RepID=A0A1G9XSJ1_9PSEU|nr:hypothetical protein SAMN04488074_13124 [Lentzea albidocapillata subsp. violacea]